MRSADLLADQSWYQLLIPERRAGVRFFREGPSLAGYRDCAAQEILRALLLLPQEGMGAAAPGISRSRRQTIRTSPRAMTKTRDGTTASLSTSRRTEIVAKLKELKGLIEAGDLKPWQFGGLRAIWFGQHLYEPLLHLAGQTCRDQPGSAEHGRAALCRGPEGISDETPGCSRTGNSICCAI